MEQVKVQTSYFARGLKAKNKKMQNMVKTSRSRATSRSRDLLKKQATEALRNGKIREHITFGFQHGYRGVPQPRFHLIRENFGD